MRPSDDAATSCGFAPVGTLPSVSPDRGSMMESVASVLLTTSNIASGACARGAMVINSSTQAIAAHLTTRS
jgi:hypothetical protein